MGSAPVTVNEAGARANSAPRRAWRSVGYAVVFWILAAVGIPVMVGAWMLLPLASLEEVTEQGKALAAGSTMAGTTFVFGVLPLVVAHLIGFALLCMIGWVGAASPRNGVLRGAAAVAVASAIGLVAALLLSGGELIYTPNYIP